MRGKRTYESVDLDLIELIIKGIVLAEKENTKKRFYDFLARKNLRLTSQRRVIVDTVFATEQHFTAAQLLQWSRARDKSVSKATVYRTLPLLTESGLVREMDFGKDYRFYDPNCADRPNHSHIICQDCNKIFEFESEEIEQLEDEVARKMGFSIQTRRLEITARCEVLRRFGSCKNMPPEK